jgi:hypothetical protein
LSGLAGRKSKSATHETLNFGLDWRGHRVGIVAAHVGAEPINKKKHMEQSKKWWQSKIVLLALTLALVFSGNFVNVFLMQNGITDDQINAVAVNAPEIAAKLEGVNSLNELITALGAIIAPIIAIARIWFTSAQIQK